LTKNHFLKFFVRVCVCVCVVRVRVRVRARARVDSSNVKPIFLN